jgi:2-keto-3-deoxy-L-rhamnonate aldolase RhmA
VFIGQGDLTQTLGDRAAAQKLVDRALAACVARGIPACTTAYGEDVSSRLEQGFKWLAVAADTGLFTNAVKQRLATLRQ